MSDILNYLVNLGIIFDMVINAILGGEAGQTLSYRAAVGMEDKKPGWCVFCRLLSWLVQHDHCQDQLSGVPMGLDNELRAFAGLIILAGLLAAPAYFGAHLIQRLL